MSEESVNDAPENTPEDPVKNIKAEFNRKQANMESKMDALSQANQQLLAQLAELNQNLRPKEPESNMSDLYYDDPEKFAATIEERAEKRILSKYEAEKKREAENNRVLNEIYSEFPEAQSSDHQLTKRAMEIFDSSSEKSAAALEKAVYRAASEYGIKPKSRRSAETDEEFSLPGGSRGNRMNRKKREKEDELSPRTLAFAAKVGLDISNPEVIERLKKHNKKFVKQIKKEEDGRYDD